MFNKVNVVSVLMTIIRNKLSSCDDQIKVESEDSVITIKADYQCHTVCYQGQQQGNRFQNVIQRKIFALVRKKAKSNLSWS